MLVHGVNESPNGDPGDEPRRPDEVLVPAAAMPLWVLHYVVECRECNDRAGRDIYCAPATRFTRQEHQLLGQAAARTHTSVSGHVRLVSLVCIRVPPDFIAKRLGRHG